MIVALCTSDGQLVKRLEVPELLPEIRLPKKMHFTFDHKCPPESLAEPNFFVHRFKYAGMGWPIEGMSLRMTREGIPVYIEVEH